MPSKMLTTDIPAECNIYLHIRALVTFRITHYIWVAHQNGFQTDSGSDYAHYTTCTPTILHIDDYILGNSKIFWDNSPSPTFRKYKSSSTDAFLSTIVEIVTNRIRPITRSLLYFNFRNAKKKKVIKNGAKRRVMNISRNLYKQRKLILRPEFQNWQRREAFIYSEIEHSHSRGDMRIDIQKTDVVSTKNHQQQRK